MRLNEYATNGKWPGGPLQYDENARQTIQMIRKYDDGKLCEICHYFNEAWEEITKEDFIQLFLRENDKYELIDPPCDCFEITIDQSNKPQTLLVRPKPTSKDKGKRLMRSLRKHISNILWQKDAA